MKTIKNRKEMKKDCEHQRILQMRYNLEKWRHHDSSFFPYSAELHIVQRCNLSCKYCGGGTRFSNEKEMSFQELRNVIGQCLQMQVKEFNFSGPEPFTRKKELLSIIRDIKKNNRRVSISTNGTLLEQKDIINLINLGCDELCVSLDSHISSVNDYLRNSPKTFDKVIKTLKLFQKYKFGGKKNPQISITSVISTLNHKHLYDFARYISDYDIDCINFQPLMIQTNGAENLVVNDTQLETVLESLNQISRLLKKLKISSNAYDLCNSDYFIKSNNSFELRLGIAKIKKSEYENNIICYNPWYNINILHNLYLGPCIKFAELKTCSFKSESLNQIWFGNIFNQIRDDIINKKYRESCRDCNVCAEGLIELKNQIQ